MMGMLMIDDSKQSLKDSIGKKITRIEFKEAFPENDDAESFNNAIYFTFSDGSKVKLYDAGQDCCEKRFLTTDVKDFRYYVGSLFLGVEIVDAPTQEDEYGYPHEIQFLNISTTKGVFTMTNHNIHNGYYGGFSICFEKVD